MRPQTMRRSAGRKSRQTIMLGVMAIVLAACGAEDVAGPSESSNQPAADTRPEVTVAPTTSPPETVAPQTSSTGPVTTAPPTTVPPTTVPPTTRPPAQSESTEIIEPSLPGLVEFEGGDIFGDVAAGAGSIWIASRRGLIQVDPEEMTAIWHRDLAPGLNITFAFGSIWVAFGDAGTVTRVDPESLVELAAIRVEGHPEGIVAADDGIWVTQHFDGSISRIDPATNAVAETVVATRPGRRGPMDPALIDGDIWFAIPSYHVVARVAPGGEVELVPLPGPGAFLLPVATPQEVWLTDGTLRLTRVDRTTGEATVFDLPEDVGIGGLSNGVSIDGTAWFPGFDEAMVAVDSSGALVASVPLRGALPRRAIVDGDDVWVMSEAGGSLERIPLETFTLAASG